MELEGLLNGNNILIYFIGIMYILINKDFDKKQKIIIIYISTYMLRLFNIMDLTTILIVLNIVTFLYIGFLSRDNVKNAILCNPIDKIIDYLYKCIFEYSSVYYIIAMILMSKSLHAYISVLNMTDLNIGLFNIKINILSLALLGVTLNNITSSKYETFSFDEIKNKMDKIVKWSALNKKYIDSEKMNMLIDIEDKSYFIRDSSYNFVSLEFVKYRINRIINKIKIVNKKIMNNSGEIFTRNIMTYIRGYSTIEMQIIRTLGIKHGYNCIFNRKIYEILYSRMFFKSLRKYMNRIYLNTLGCSTFKEYLLYIYINIASVDINCNDYKNMLEPWGKSLNEVSKEEFFISILGLSHRSISNDIIVNYSNIINGYELNIEYLKLLIKEINMKV